jgi:endonuclease-3 related protein
MVKAGRPPERKSRTGGLYVAIYETLRRAYGPQRWWPVTPPRGGEPVYSGGPRTESQVFEVVVGAVLTQNTAWRNAAGAIINLNRAGLMDPAAILRVEEAALAALVRPSGYYNQKARRLRAVARFFAGAPSITRESLLALDGIGPETADSIMLYALGKPYFVVDAYTRRIFGRIGLIDEKAPYEEIRASFERRCPRRLHLYREYHALIVEHGKRSCRRSPLCADCVIARSCAFDRGGGKSTFRYR